MFSESTYRWLFRTSSFVLLLVVITLSLIPHPKMIPQEFGDKYQHFCAYGLLAFCFVQWSPSIRRRFMWCLILIFVGVLVEFVQPYFGRQFDIQDMIANTLGVGIGLTIGTIVRLLKSQRIKSTVS